MASLGEILGEYLFGMPQDAEVVEGTRGNVLPGAKYRLPDGTERWGVAAPQGLADALLGLGAAGGRVQDPNAPEGYVSQETLRRGGEGLAGSAAMGAVGGQAAIPAMRAPKNAVGIFAGPRARGADIDALQKAKYLTERGATRDDIWRETGWFKGPDGNWRWEIDDSKAALTPWDKNIHGAANESWPREARKAAGVQERYRPMALGEYLSHPDLQKAYLSQGGPSVRLGLYEPDTSGAFRPMANEIKMNLRRFTEDLDPKRREELVTALHETQHYVQQREGFAGGSNMNAPYDKFVASRQKQKAAARAEYEDMRRRLSQNDRKALDAIGEFEDVQNLRFETNGKGFWEAMPDEEFDVLSDQFEALYKSLSPEAKKVWSAKAKFEVMQGNPSESEFRVWQQSNYRNNPGEVEARAVEARQPLTAEERRARPPWLDYDVPEGDILAANPLAGAVPLTMPAPGPQGPTISDMGGRPIPPEEEAQRQALIRYLEGGM